MWVGENESVKSRATILSALKYTRIEEIFVACMDNLIDLIRSFTPPFPKPQFRTASSTNCVIPATLLIRI